MQHTMAALLAALAASACGAKAPQGLRWREVAQRHWLELRSQHFVFTTDLPNERALERFAELEEARQSLLDHFVLVLPDRMPKMRPIRVLYLARCEDFQRSYHRPAFGYVTEAGDWDDWSGIRLMAGCDREENRHATVLHEITHVITESNFPHTAPWLAEGLAEYFETLEVKDGVATIGKPPTSRAWRDPAVPPIRRLMAMEEEFYDPPAYPMYMAAWRLVHLLGSSAYRDRFATFLRALRAGTPQGTAWLAVFGSASELERLYWEYGDRAAIPVYRTRMAARGASSPVTVRALRPGERHAIWFQLLMTGGETDTDRARRDAAAAQLLDMERDDPRWAGTLFWRARFLDDQPDRASRARVEPLLRAYLEREPRDARAWTALVRNRIRRSIPDGYLALDGSPPAALEAIEPDVRGLLAVAQSAAALDQVGRYYALRRQPKIGLPFAFRALADDSTCGECYETLALLLLQHGRIDDGLAAQQTAVLIAAQRGSADAPRKRLEAYRRWRDARPPAAGATPEAPPGP